MPDPHAAPNKPYERLDQVLADWRTMEVQARADLALRRRRRRLATVILVLFAATDFGLGLTLVSVMRAHEAETSAHAVHVNSINQSLGAYHDRTIADLETRQAERSAQLTTLQAELDKANAAAAAARKQRDDAQAALDVTLPPDASPEAIAAREAQVARLQELTITLEAAEPRRDQLVGLVAVTQRSVDSIESQIGRLEFQTKAIEQERAERQALVEDDSSPLTALTADLEAAERRVKVLIEDNEELRKTNERLSQACAADKQDE